MPFSIYISCYIFLFLIRQNSSREELDFKSNLSRMKRAIEIYRAIRRSYLWIRLITAPSGLRTPTETGFCITDSLTLSHRRDSIERSGRHIRVSPECTAHIGIRGFRAIYVVGTDGFTSIERGVARRALSSPNFDPRCITTPMAFQGALFPARLQLQV